MGHLRVRPSVHCELWKTPLMDLDRSISAEVSRGRIEGDIPLASLPAMPFIQGYKTNSLCIHVRVNYSLSLAYHSLPVAEPERFLPVPHLLPATGGPAPLSALFQALLFEVLQGRPHERCVCFGCAAYVRLVQKSTRLSWAEAPNLSDSRHPEGKRPTSQLLQDSKRLFYAPDHLSLPPCVSIAHTAFTSMLSKHCSLLPPPPSALAYARAAQLPILQVRDGRSGERGTRV